MTGRNDLLESWEEDPMEKLSQILWRERELLDSLLFKLEMEQLVLGSGRTRWLARAAKEVALGAVLVPGGDRRAAGRLVRGVARAADADYLLAIGSGPFGPGGLVRLPRVGPLLTYREITAPAPPPSWDLTLGDIELF